jgi:fungalysin metallopeptidase (M36)/PA domain-containing protein/K319-like protein
MKRSIRLLILPAVLLGALPASAEEKPNFDAYFDAATAPAKAARITRASADGVASAIDAQRGVPTFIWAGKQQPVPPLAFAGSAEGAAMFYVGAYAHRWNLAASVIDTLELAHVHDTGRGGIVVTFRQRFGGIEVFRGEVKVLLARNLELIALSGSPSSRVKGKGAFKLGAADAIAAGLNDLYGTSAKPGDIVALKKHVADYHYFDLGSAAATAGKIKLIEPFRLKKVFFAMPTGMVPAYWFEIQASKADKGGSDVFTYVVAADDVRLLLRTNLTESDVNSYRVWADPSDGRPLDGPIADYSPSPTGVPDGSAPPFIAPILKPMDGFNTNPFGSGDPWLPSGAKQTLGNNVDAYTDDGPGPTLANGQLPPTAPPDGFSNGDLRATVTAPGVFDRVYDVNVGPLVSTAQSMAATTQLFYDTNWLHDWFYDSGFNEAAGNAQADNYNRGGLGGDVLHAESQDGAVAGSRSNANMSTPADGASPRMQMYLWTGINFPKLTDVATGADIPTNTASFGAENFSLTGPLVLADDGVAPVNNGCEPIVNDVAGKIALIDRGVCAFAAKAAAAQAAGAIGVIIANNAPNVAAPGLGGADPTVTIPVLSVTLEQGNAFKAALLTGPLDVKMDRVSGVERDGSIDNTVVAHEWGHYIHHRLVQCGLNQCRGQSEGWGDFNAIQMIMRPGDNLDGVYPLVQYAAATLGPDYSYFGIRRAPYSTDMTKNGFTFKHIADGTALPATPLASGGATNSEVHNTGEIWAQMMFEGYIALLKTTVGPNPNHTFQEVRRTMSDYVVAGMKLTPVEPDFNEQRDAMLAAMYANSPGDMQLFADAFAKRGLGTCSVSPLKTTADNTGLKEDFATHGNFAILSVDLDDSVSSCDKDGVLDAEETGTITVKVMNSGVTPLDGTVVNLTTTTTGVTFPNGAQVTLPTIAPFAVGTATIQVALDTAVSGIQSLDLHTDVTNALGCKPTLSDDQHFAINYDNLTSAANIDNVESDLSAWKVTGANGDKIWAREVGANGNHSWHGVDFSSLSDTSLESPTLDVSATDALVVSFNHAYSFEADATVNWDGGVIEISTNGGQTWGDISTYVAPGYGGPIGNTASNPLMNRQAFVGANAAFPASEAVSLNLGTQLAGKKIKLRFRIGTDLGAGEFGWNIDNVVVQGITNTPFTAIVADTTNCEHAPVANAGVDQMVPTSTGVILDGSASADADGDPLTFAWKQTAGPLVPIINPQAAKTTFLAPAVLVDTTLTFEVAVSDATQTAKDSVTILVQPIPVVMTTGATGAGGAGGAGGSTSGNGGAGGTGGVVDPATTASTGDVTSAGAGGSGGELPLPVVHGNCDCSTGDLGGNNAPSNGALGAGVLGAALFFARRRRLGR